MAVFQTEVQSHQAIPACLPPSKVVTHWNATFGPLKGDTEELGNPSGTSLQIT